MWVKGVVALPCRLGAPNKVRLGGWGWCIACDGREEFNDMAMDWGDIPWLNPEGTAWQLLRSTEGLKQQQKKITCKKQAETTWSKLHPSYGLSYKGHLGKWTNDCPPQREKKATLLAPFSHRENNKLIKAIFTTILHNSVKETKLTMPPKVWNLHAMNLHYFDLCKFT